MTTLRLTQSSLDAERFRVEAALEEEGRPRRMAVTDFEFPITPQDREDLRWYLEEYLQYAADPAPKIAARVEKRIAEIGTALFATLFQTDEDARDMWAVLRDRLDDTRIEIVSDVREAASVPWELLRDPKTRTPLALSANAFVRAAHRSAVAPRVVQQNPGAVRILLVICRPGRDHDVPFRSVASRLIKALDGKARETLQLDVLRPPTFAELSAVLRAAKAEGNPYHVVHFDGHGAFFDAEGRPASAFLTPPRDGPHGYLVFENPGVEKNRQYVDGPSLGRLLWETGVPVLVLSACRSAHAEPRAEPETAPQRNVHAEARAFGSLAQEVVDMGVGGVVAMRYNVYVVTAAQFVADLYESLANGETLGEAVTLGRKQLQAQPLREIAYEPRPLQDWMVPIVHEAAPIALFARPEKKAEWKIQVTGNAAAPYTTDLAREVQERPDAGFFGRDETLLALDRAFDTQAIVLLHAYAGSGKSATAKEFARWYHLTGGIKGPVLFTSFERYKPLAQVLNETIGRTFEGALERAGVHWLTLSDEERRNIALEVLAQIPVFWIWDNVEPVHGFPAGTQSAWSDAEQDELADFLRAAAQTQAKFLLTSRREEREWLDVLPARIEIPAMPMQERVQLARALALKHGRTLTAVDDWMPLLRFTRGNPMTITVLVGQALRKGLRTRGQIEAFVERLRAGAAAFDDEASEGRDRSLGASLAYGFDDAFTEEERAQLALLYLFQGFVDVDALVWMGKPKSSWALVNIEGLTRDHWIALLDRAADIGLLSRFGSGYYGIHPALPWYFRSLFAVHYESAAGTQALHAFVETMGMLGNFYFERYEEGNRGVATLLEAEEANLLHARRLARTHGWHAPVLGTMQGLRELYDQTGRRAEWTRLVDEVVPDFVDTVTDAPFPGREDQWIVVNGYRVRLAREGRRWAEAERLQRILIDWTRRHAAPLLDLPVESLDIIQKHDLRTLAVSIEELGQTQRELGQLECVASYEEALSLYERIADRPAAAGCTFCLGHAYLTLEELHDLDRAESWYRQSLELRAERDSHGRARCVGQLGYVEYLRARQTDQGQQQDVTLRHLSASLAYYSEALNLLPENAADDRGITHAHIGNSYDALGDAENARAHWHEAIRYAESAAAYYSAGHIRWNMSRLLAREGRFADAREYALAALRDFERFGAGAAEEVASAKHLLALIEEDLKTPSP